MVVIAQIRGRMRCAGEQDRYARYAYDASAS
jgi:hypothetical protein